MTQNDIAYYNAQNERRDMRLKRKETKRHNVAQEALGVAELGTRQLSAEAALASAEAAGINAAANSKNAATRAAEHQLEWEKEYGWPYGTPREIMDSGASYVYWDVEEQKGYSKPQNVPSGDIYITAPGGIQTPASYDAKLYSNALNVQNVKQGNAKTAESWAGTVGKYAGTASIISDTLYRNLRRAGLVGYTPNN